MATQPGLRARKKEQTRSQLERVALELFAARGYDAVTVEDIAAEVDVSPRTFFRHFASKDDVLVAFYREYGERLREILASRPPEEHPVMSVRHAMLTLADSYQQEKEALFQRTSIMANTPALVGAGLEVQSSWEVIITEMIASRLEVNPEADMRPGLLAACAVAALRVATNQWLTEGADATLPDLVDDALLFVAGNIDRQRRGRTGAMASGDVAVQA